MVTLAHFLPQTGDCTLVRARPTSSKALTLTTGSQAGKGWGCPLPRLLLHEPHPGTATVEAPPHPSGVGAGHLDTWRLWGFRVDQRKEAGCRSCHSASPPPGSRGVGAGPSSLGPGWGPRWACPGGPGPECSSCTRRDEGPSGRDPGGPVSPRQCPSLGGGPPQWLSLPRFPLCGQSCAGPPPALGRTGFMAGACGATEYLALVVPAPSEDSWHQSEQAAGRPWAERRRGRGQEGKGMGLCQAAWAPTCELLPEAVPDGPPPPATRVLGTVPAGQAAISPELGHLARQDARYKKIQKPKPGGRRKPRPQGPVRTRAPPSGGGMAQPRATRGAAPQVPCTGPPS